jgi:lysophospholipase L1-like esterase
MLRVRLRPSPARALVLAALLSGGALSAGCNRDGNGTPAPTAPTPPPAASAPVHYAAFGASDAIGVGASRMCAPLAPCPDGTGYVPVIARRLTTGRAVTLTNLGIPGAVLGPATQALARRHGRDILGNFLDNELPFLPRDATLVTVFAGGNDVNALVAVLEAGGATSDEGAFVAQQARQFATDLDALVSGIRDRAPSTRIVVANLPNLALLPYASGYGAARRQRLQQLSAALTGEAINPLAGRGVIVVDLLCDPRAYTPGQYSADGFHPNDAGYAYLADVLMAGITADLPPPRSSCPEANRF